MLLLAITISYINIETSVHAYLITKYTLNLLLKIVQIIKHLPCLSYQYFTLYKRFKGFLYFLLQETLDDLFGFKFNFLYNFEI